MNPHDPPTPVPACAPKTIIVVLAVMFLMVGTCFAEVGSCRLFQNYQYSIWPHVNAEITSTSHTMKEITPKGGGIGLVDYCTPTIQFTANGNTQTYTGPAAVKNYQVGYLVPIVFNPNDPSVVYMQQPHSDRSVITDLSVGAACVVIACGLLGWYISRWRRQISRPASEYPAPQYI
jgi:hypothetical protein